MTNQYDDEMRKELCFLIYVSHKEVVNQFNQYLKQYDISFPNYIMLLYLDNDRPIYVKTLCKELYLDSGTISPIIKRLEKKELINRVRTQEDERRVQIHLTEKGTKLKQDFNKISRHVFGQFKMSEEDAVEYYRILRKFTDNNIIDNADKED
ncbi:MarR family winged helix-turn-helix transcriptional regulator [Staphylococcus auricularis]|uniref:MarR family winged helix-turn-helix transcriptional regulator n=1 Tax=Staphylococcus auricularis TaxID=29379 RepID=UPI003EBE2676